MRRKYSNARMFPTTSPFTITCEPTSLVGLRSIGFISTDGSVPDASASITRARPNTRPKPEKKEFSASSVSFDLGAGEGMLVVLG